MPAWWKGKGKGKGKGKEGVGEEERKKKKAGSFDEALLLGKGGGGGGGKTKEQQVVVVGHPLPRPASMPASSAPGSGSASASASSGGGSSSLGSSAASDEPPDLGNYRIPEASYVLPGRILAIDSRKQSPFLEEGRFFANNQTLEHPRLSETSVSPRKEFYLHNLDISNDRTAYCHGRKSSEIVFATRVPSSPPSSKGQIPCPTSSVQSRTFGQCPGSPTSRQDDSRSSSSPHPLPRPPSSPCSSSRPGSSQWKKGKLLGSGTFGQVYQGFNSEGGQMCAIKEVKVISDDNNSKECLRQLHQEIVLLSQLSHPNIVQYYGSDLSSETLSVYLEYVSGGSIHKLLQEYGAFGEAVLRNYTAQILCGIAYLHGRNTMHRDIKGANILVDPNGDIKLADFGMAKHIAAHTSIKSFKGSPYWMAPEVIMNSNGYSLSVDIWSLGCTIIEMATARPPWIQYEGVAAIFKIGNSKDIPDIPDHLSFEAKNFLRLCLQRDPAARPTAAQLMEHPFVKDLTANRSFRSGLTRDMFPTSFDGKGVKVQTSNRSLSPLRDPDLTMRNLPGPTAAMPSISTRRISAINPSNVRMNMSLPVSPCSSPLRQYRQSNRSCMPSPPHPAYSAGAANYSPINNALYPTRPSNHLPDPWLEISQLKAPQFDSPRRL
uniref:mitogen-activated protein kinase kinase kinase n=1 Tax=Leersia perrieri TaxID=77586 RepID=A0A0D9XQ71_9ORYZ